MRAMRKTVRWHLARMLLPCLLACACLTWGIGAAPALASPPCANAQLRAKEGSAELPDCRAYEMVTPADKTGADGISLFEGWHTRSSESGEAIIYGSMGNGFAGGSSACALSQYLSRRTPEGWVTQGISPPHVGDPAGGISPCRQVAYQENYFTPDLSRGLLIQEDPPLTPEAPPGEANMYIADLADPAHPAYQLLTPTIPQGNPPYAWVVNDEPDPTVPSDGLQQIVFTQPDKLLPEAPAGGTVNVYEWSAGQLKLVSVGPGGKALTGGAAPGSDLPGAGNNSQTVQTHAVSADGSRVFFSSPLEQPIYLHSPSLYMRENGVRTVEVSASQKTNGSGPGGTDPHGHQADRFWGANKEGTQVLFSSCEQLTNDSTAVFSGRQPCGGSDPQGQDLYRYDVESGALTDLTVDPNPTDPYGADIQGVTASSEDGSYVYFVADGVLSAAPNPQGETAIGPASGEGTLTSGSALITGVDPTARTFRVGMKVQGTGIAPRTIISAIGAGTFTISRPAEASGREPLSASVPNLYLNHNGVNIFIATLTNEEIVESFREGDAPIWKPKTSFTPARVTGDGTHLLFASYSPLTGYDNTDPTTGEPVTEVYLYDSSSGGLSCISCNPKGTPPRGGARLGEQQTQGYMSRNLSSDGRRAFFESFDSLVTADTNTLGDVYEWESPGEGSCEGASPAFSVADSGCIYLLSPGGGEAPMLTAHGNVATAFLDASPDGEDVFLATRQRLRPEDVDGATDVYDVRSEGGFPLQVPPAEACESAGACHSGGTNPAVQTAFGTESFIGPVQSTAKACRSDFVLRHGSCVHRKHRRRRHRGPRRQQSISKGAQK